MDDLILSAEIDNETTLYISPIDSTTYEEHDEDGVLGGESGYFILRSTASTLELLAKSPTFEAASEIFDMIVFAKNRMASTVN